jgi:hypothetical protein
MVGMTKYSVFAVKGSVTPVSQYVSILPLPCKKEIFIYIPWEIKLVQKNWTEEQNLF